MNDLSLFNFNGHDVRVVMIDGAPWWVAGDIPEALGWTRENLRYHQRSTLAPDERGVARLPTPGVSRTMLPSPRAGSTSSSCAPTSPRPAPSTATKSVIVDDILPTTGRASQGGPTTHEPLTMSSLEIAELTGKDHKNVLADIRKMLVELGNTSADFSADVPDSYGRSRFVYSLPKRETMILVSGYSIALRARIVDRWQELEAQLAQSPAPQFAIPQSLPEALRLAAEQAERAIAAEEKLAIAAPKAQALDELADAEDMMRHVEKSRVGVNHPSDFPNRGTTCISEGGLYRLVNRSDKAQARPFQDRANREVLPAARQETASAYRTNKEHSTVFGEINREHLRPRPRGLD